MLTVTLAESGRFGLQGVQVHHIQMRKPRHKHESGEKECDFGRIGTPLGSSTGSTDGGQCFFFQVVFLSPSLSKAKAQIPHIHDQILQDSSDYAISCSLPLHPMKYQCHQPYYWAAWRVGCYFGRAGTSWERQDFPERAYTSLSHIRHGLRFSCDVLTCSGRKFTVKHAADLAQQ